MLSLSPQAQQIKGQVIAPDDPAYDRARTVFNAAIDRRPALIVRAADAEDVARVITLARETGTELAIRSGGHSPAGHSVPDDAVVIDLAEFRELEIDADQRTAWAGTGVTAGEYVSATGEHGLSTGFGDAGPVGLGGITLAGGVGFLARKHGLAIDNLLAAEIVTADGELLRVDAEQHPDLFWALRGGGGNFGVVTRLQFRLAEVGDVFGGMLFLPATPEVIEGFVVAAEAAPEELSGIANVMPAPPLPFLAPEHHGRRVVLAQLVHAGDAEAGERAVAPLRELATPLADLMRPLRYPEMFPPMDPSYRPLGVSRTGFTDGISRAAAETIMERLDASTASSPVTQLRVLGGAVARVPDDATAYAHRDRRVMFNAAALYSDTAERATHAAWADAFAAELSGGDPAAYAGFLDDEGDARVRAAYPGGTYERLAEVKAAYDPDNVFRHNHNIAPAG